MAQELTYVSLTIASKVKQIRANIVMEYEIYSATVPRVPQWLR